MINPAQVTNYNRTQYELEEFILFCINVAGKKSAIEAPKLELFIERAKNITKETTPFNSIKKLIKLSPLSGKKYGRLLFIGRNHLFSEYVC